jgi:hypothetical protein
MKLRGVRVSSQEDTFGALGQGQFRGNPGGSVPAGDTDTDAMRLKAQNFLLQSQELAVQGYQNELATLKQEIGRLKIENHVLRVRNGEVRNWAKSSAFSRNIDSGHEGSQDERVQRILLKWGLVASRVSEKHMAFLHGCLVWSVQQWIGNHGNGRFVVEAPGSVLAAIIREAVSSDDLLIGVDRLDDIVGLIESMMVSRDGRCNNEQEDRLEGGDLKDGEDIIQVAEAVDFVLRCYFDGNKREHGGIFAEKLLDRMVQNDMVRCMMVTRLACSLCMERFNALANEILGVVPIEENVSIADSSPYATPTWDLTDLVDLIKLCQRCIEGLTETELGFSRHNDASVLEQVAQTICEISKQCDIVAVVIPDVAFQGKRLHGLLVAALHKMLV